MANIAIKIWGPDLLQQWSTKINIPAVPVTHISGNDITRYYTQRSLAIQAVQEHKAISKPLEALPLKWLPE